MSDVDLPFLDPAETRPVDTGVGGKRSRTRLKIIKGAARAFACHGLEATTVAHILQSAGVSRRTYYQFFSDKIDVLRALYERSTALLVAQRRKAMDGTGDGLSRLRRGQQVYFDFIRESGPLIQVMAAEAMRPASPLMRRRLWLHQSIEDLYRTTFREAEGVDLDALAVRGLILFTESLSLHVLLHQAGDAAVMRQAQALLGRHLEQLVAQALPAREEHTP